MRGVVPVGLRRSGGKGSRKNYCTVWRLANRRDTASPRSPLPPVATRLGDTVSLGFRSPSGPAVIFARTLNGARGIRDMPRATSAYAMRTNLIVEHLIEEPCWALPVNSMTCFCRPSSRYERPDAQSFDVRRNTRPRILAPGTRTRHPGQPASARSGPSAIRTFGTWCDRWRMT